MLKNILICVLFFGVFGCSKTDKKSNIEKLDSKPYATAKGHFDNWQGYESGCASDYDIFLSPKKNKLMVRSLVEIYSEKEGRMVDCRYALVSDIKKTLSDRIRHLDFSQSRIYVDIGFLMTSATVAECQKVSRQVVLQQVMASGFDGKVKLNPNVLIEFSPDVIQFPTVTIDRKTSSDHRCATYVPTYRRHK